MVNQLVLGGPETRMARRLSPAGCVNQMLRMLNPHTHRKRFALQLHTDLLQHFEAVARGMTGSQHQMAAGHPRLGAAEYKLVHHAENGRCVYSFCMCPGGFVVGATSEEGRVVTNGMSQHSRNERNANSGLVVALDADDLAPFERFPGDPLAGIAPVSYTHLRAHETRHESRMPSSA